MADLSVRFAGIYSPTPFWLAPGPPSNSADQVKRAFDLGWRRGVEDRRRAIVNVCSRYSSVDYGGRRSMGLGFGTRKYPSRSTARASEAGRAA